MPKRIQRQRTAGWRMPENAIYVGRPTKWGNPWSVSGYFDAGWTGTTADAVAACVENHRAWMTRTKSTWSGDVPTLNGLEPPDISELRGKDLACWCPLDQPCHADVLLELANE